MNNKPFWQDKTCKEMAGLHVKVTFKNGDEITGMTNVNGDLKIPDTNNTIALSFNYGDSDFVPRDEIESIELLDSTKYERIENIDDVRVGDIYVATDGNKYTVTSRSLSNLYPLRVMICKGDNYAPPRNYFDHALRPKSKLPDHDGLWLDKGDGLWLVTGQR